MNPYLKNIPHETKLQLHELVNIQEGQVVSKTLAQNDAVSITLFAFAQGEEISSHASKGDAMISILEGTAKITIDQSIYLLHTGESIVMPANKPHAVYGERDFKMILTVVFPSEISNTNV